MLLRSICICFLICASFGRSYSQALCDTDTMPCYRILSEELNLLGDWDSRQPVTALGNWPLYEAKLKLFYPEDINQIKTRFLVEPSGWAIAEGFVLCHPSRGFTIAERWVMDWGGVFYFIDFSAMTKKVFYERLRLENLELKSE